MRAQHNRAQLKVRTTDRAEGEVFDLFFQGYDLAFVLPDEKEDRDGLAECLALNHGSIHAALAQRYGPFRELCLVAEDDSGEQVGGANFIAMLAPADPCIVTANLNYIYVAPAARGRGNLRRLVRAVFETAASLFDKEVGILRTLVFIEQNDPFRMSPEAYEQDTRFSGLDQLDRLRIWARLGARIVDFPYVQPALSAGQDADDGLIYSVLGSAEAGLPPSLLRGHLERFFGISVLKGRVPASDEAAAAQLAQLRTMVEGQEAIALLDPGPLLDRLGGRPPRAGPGSDGARSFREVLASLACAGGRQMQPE